MIGPIILQEFGGFECGLPNTFALLAAWPSARCHSSFEVIDEGFLGFVESIRRDHFTIGDAEARCRTCTKIVAKNILAAWVHCLGLMSACNFQDQAMHGGTCSARPGAKVKRRSSKR